MFGVVSDAKECSNLDLSLKMTLRKWLKLEMNGSRELMRVWPCCMERFSSRNSSRADACFIAAKIASKGSVEHMLR